MIDDQDAGGYGQGQMCVEERVSDLQGVDHPADISGEG